MAHRRKGSPAPAEPPALAASDLALLAEGRHPDPFSILGRHSADGLTFVRVWRPDAAHVALLTAEGAASAMASAGNGIFTAPAPATGRYRLRVGWADGSSADIDDPYAFGLLLSEQDIYLFQEGRHFDLATRMGANPRCIDGVDGVLFAVWAPNALSVSVVGDFNGWDARRHPMRRRLRPGIWELFLPGVQAGALYKYAIVDRHGQRLPWKADPLGRLQERPPGTASMVAAPFAYAWTDGDWMAARAHADPMAAPMAVYEVHVGSWLRTQAGALGSWDEAVERLIPYLRYLRFTHVELLPIMEHPFGGSWGYQPLGMFAPTARLGPPEALARFIDGCHRAGIGVILDWVPGHFPNDEHGLACFDGTHLYEHADPRQGFHPDWNTLVYNHGRREVCGFLLASALWWLKTFHIDGLRVDAVASMLYRDYSRPPGEWVPNHLGGRENFEAVSFLQELNTLVGGYGEGAVTIAEESTAWPGVTTPVHHGGLGFHFKWNMGWMHDTLRYFGRDPVHRSHHGHDITFGLHYAFSENFVLPVSHDEVVHGKGSLLGRMPGDDWQRFANLRLFLAWMWTHPGKKLLFMGCEFGQQDEWDADGIFPWPADDDGYRRGAMHMLRDLNALYRNMPALHRRDHEAAGFRWAVADDNANAVFAFWRLADPGTPPVLVIANMTPVPRAGYRIGVPHPGLWRECFNSDAGCYGGSGAGNGGQLATTPLPWQDEAQSLSLLLPPLGLLLLAPADMAPAATNGPRP